MALVNINGLNKEELLLELWNQQKFKGFNRNNNPNNKPSLEDAKKVLHENFGSIDYFWSKRIRMNFTSNMIDPIHYDGHAGIGTCQRVVNNMILYGKDAEIKFLNAELDKLHQERNAFGNYLRSRLNDPSLKVLESQLYEHLCNVYWGRNF
jgi:hypothetical protein